MPKNNWQLADDGRPFLYLLNDLGVNKMYAQIQGGYTDNGTRTTKEELVAQARKFAAVEELLEIAKHVEAGGMSYPQWLREKAAAAIAQAEGGK